MITVETIELAREALTTSKRSLVVFVARWCPLCKILSLNLEEFNYQNPDVPIYKIDSLNFKELAIEYNATAVPVTFVIDKGFIVKTHQGYLEVDDLKELYYNKEEE